MKYKVWWMCGEKIQNFGDVLTPKIFEHFNIDYEYSKEYNTICVGSIASAAKENCKWICVIEIYNKFIGKLFLD